MDTGEPSPHRSCQAFQFQLVSAVLQCYPVKRALQTSWEMQWLIGESEDHPCMYWKIIPRY